MKPAKLFLSGLLVLILMPSLAPCQNKRDKAKEANTRSVEGIVRDVNDNTVNTAVVQLKNTKTLQVRSFITREEGRYQFHGLSTNIDYELKAEYQDKSSPVRRLSVFDSRKKAVINLNLEPHK